MLANKLKDLIGPLVDLPPIDQTEVKFNGRSRLYIGNFTSDLTEEEIQNLFAAYGETAELFVNKEKNFGFIKMVRTHYSTKTKVFNLIPKSYLAHSSCVLIISIEIQLICLIYQIYAKKGHINICGITYTEYYVVIIKQFYLA